MVVVGREMRRNISKSFPSRVFCLFVFSLLKKCGYLWEGGYSERERFWKACPEAASSARRQLTSPKLATLQVSDSQLTGAEAQSASIASWAKHRGCLEATLAWNRVPGSNLAGLFPQMDCFCKASCCLPVSFVDLASLPSPPLPMSYPMFI